MGPSKEGLFFYFIRMKSLKRMSSHLDVWEGDDADAEDC